MATAPVFVYFADSRCLQREEVRRFCLRIPEVATEIRKIQKEAKHDDVFLLLWEAEEFRALDFQEQIFYFNVIQRGLFLRLQKKIKGEGNVLRTEEELAQLHSEELVPEVWIIGPLTDTAGLQFMKSGGVLRNFLEEDSMIREGLDFSETPEIQAQ